MRTADTSYDDRLPSRFYAARDSFFPASPGLEERIMAAVEAEAAPDAVPLRTWVAAGVFVLLSLFTAYFGVDFISVSRAAGSAFLVPIGLTFGLVITVYGALFIASHLDELSERFELFMNHAAR